MNKIKMLEKQEKANRITPQEIRGLMSFYRAMHRDVGTGFLLKIGGFKINGLGGAELAKSPCLGHRFAWNDFMGYGLCTCGRWETEAHWTYELGQAQHQMHARRERPAKVEQEQSEHELVAV